MYHIVCRGEGRILGVTHRMDIFSNSKPEAEGLVLIIKSLFPDVMAVSVGYEYLPFEINREFSVIMDCNSDSAMIEFSEFDSSDLERIKRYRSSYINAELRKESMFGCGLISWIVEERLLLDIARSDRDLEILTNFLPNESVHVSSGKIESTGVDKLYAIIKREKYCHNVVRRWCVWNPRSCGGWLETRL
jgi:hypothetical protein